MSNVNIASLRAKLKEIKTGKSQQNFEYMEKFWYPPEYDPDKPQRSVIRILPSAKEGSDFFVETLLYRINNKNFHSPRLKNMPDPISEYTRALWATGDEENIKIARELKAGKRFYMNVIARERVVLNSETGKEEVRKDDGPLIFSCGVKVIERILKAIVDEEEYGDIIDLKKGYDFRVIREKRDGYPNYDDSKPVKNPSPAGTNEQILKWMENLHDLNELIKISSYEELKRELDIFRGISEDSKSSEHETAAEESNSSKTVSKSKETVDEGSNDDDDDEFLKELDRIKNRD